MPDVRREYDGYTRFIKAFGARIRTMRKESGWTYRDMVVLHGFICRPGRALKRQRMACRCLPCCGWPGPSGFILLSSSRVSRWAPEICQNRRYPRKRRRRLPVSASEPPGVTLRSDFDDWLLSADKVHAILPIQSFIDRAVAI